MSLTEARTDFLNQYNSCKIDLRGSFPSETCTALSIIGCNLINTTTARVERRTESSE